LFAIPAARFRGIPIVNNQITSIAKSKGGFEKLLYYQLPFAFSKIIVGNSQTGLSSYSAKPAKARCIYNGFNLDRLEKLKPKEAVRKELGIQTPFVVGMVASTVPAKDYQTYFDSAAEVLKTRDDVTFVAIGGGVKKKYTPYVQQKKTAGILLFEARKQVENDMNIFDIGVLSSFYEGFPNVVLEMMALGKPVIATNVGGTAELIEDGKDGFLFTTGDKEKLVKLINVLLDDHAKRNTIGDYAREKVQEKFNLNRMLSAYERIYREATEGKS
jgi:glycosyltransferase involved in cell wall biosynthesis